MGANAYPTLHSDMVFAGASAKSVVRRRETPNIGRIDSGDVLDVGGDRQA